MRYLSDTKKVFFWVLLTAFNVDDVQAQISPPGLGKAKTAFWTAFGLRKKLDSAGHKQSMTYIAVGRKSSLDNINPFSKQAIFVLNHEFYNHFSRHQQYSYAISYRRQNDYKDAIPYQSEGIEQEFRAYGRYAYILPFGRWKWTNTWRQEFRKFFTADFRKTDENFQLRTRLKTQLIYSLSEKHKQGLALSAESLFATSLLNDDHKNWSAFAYKESRLGIYYMFKIPHTPLSMDIGYVNDLISGNKAANFGVHYLAADVVFNLPY